MLITALNAREMQANAVAARKRNRLAREGNPQLACGSPTTVGIFNITRARTMEKLIDKTLAQYAKSTDAKEQQALAMALDRLYGTWADMTGHERRAVGKNKKKKPAFDESGMLDTPDAPLPEP